MREEGLFQARRVTFQRARVPGELLVHPVKKIHIFFIKKEMVGQQSKNIPPSTGMRTGHYRPIPTQRAAASLSAAPRREPLRGVRCEV